MADIKSEKEQLNALENLFQQKRFSDALEVAQKASSDYPNSYQLKFLYARTLKELNKLVEAEQVLKELMLIYPNNINLLLESGSLAVMQNKFDEGNEFYNKILFLDPFNADAKNSIEKINMIKKGELPGKAIGDSFSHQNKNLQSADTLPEFDSMTLRDILNEEPPPPPIPELLQSPSSPPAPETEEFPGVSDIQEVDTDEETWMAGLSREKMQEQEMIETGIPQSMPIYNSEEMDSPLGIEAEIPVYEVPLIPGLANEPEETDVSYIAEPPIEMEQALERQEESEAEETGFVTESAAQLYVEQGLLDDAVGIYKKLYGSRKEERFIRKIEELKRVLISQKKIRVLNELLEYIKLKGEKIV
jgi:tetratricopeptide (TPR) repeat protein